jgi:MYXO-CTERM domain-containing protein
VVVRTRSGRWVAGVALAAVVFGALAGGNVRAGQVPNPTVTASADPFSPQYVADNVFEAGHAEFATSGNGAGTPFSTDPNVGTWIEFDFGSPVSFDTFINRTRVNPVDVVGRSRLVFSQDPTFDDSDTTLTFESTGSNGSGLVRRIPQITAQYVRWEALTSTGTSQNLGARQMFFLQTPAGTARLAPPTVYNGSAPFSPAYALQNAANDNAGRDGTGNEYASRGGGASTFVDFDFGKATALSGFDFLNREDDVITAYDMIFSDSPNFTSPIQTLSFTASENGNQVNSQSFDPILARYVRLRATAFTGSPNTGVSDILFFSPVPEPACLPLLGVAALAMVRRRRGESRQAV